MTEQERRRAMTEVEKVARCHNIKCWPEPFEAMKRGEKTAEFCK